MKITIYADSFEDALLALRMARQESRNGEARAERQRKRQGVGWAYGHAFEWSAWVWGGPEHWRVDCRKANYQPKERN